MSMKVALSSAVLACAMTSGVAFSPSSHQPTNSRLNYRSYEDVDAGAWQDVNGEKTSLSPLLEPPSESPPVPQPPADVTNATPKKKGTRSRAVKVASPVQQIRTIPEFRNQVLREKEKIAIVRFSAPWCRNCKVTNVAYERMAAKLRSSSDRIKCMSVNLDGKDETAQLREMMAIEKVPSGVIYHPELGALWLNLSRKNLSSLKKELEGFVENDHDIDFDVLLNSLVEDRSASSIAYK